MPWYTGVVAVSAKRGRTETVVSATAAPHTASPAYSTR